MIKTIDYIIRKKQSHDKISMLTCYDYAMSKLLAQTDLDMILVGDSLANVKLGLPNTLSVTVDDMIYHSRSVRAGNSNALIVCDMPFMSYEIDAKTALENAGRIIKEGHANAVKIEGGQEIIEQAKALAKAKIPVMGHLGLTPQSINVLGGFKVQARQKEEQEKIIQNALALQNSGAFAIVLEAIPEAIAKEITNALAIPTIGIGAGRFCDGQVLVLDDMLGIFEDFKPKFVKRYANLAETIKDSVNKYISEVSSETFPEDENTYK
jgi:3-methyl-2-oxobutanoate hydroxymethyltransferase